MRLSRVMIAVIWTLIFMMFVFTHNVNAKVLTKKGGINTFEGHHETWYNLSMDKVIARSDALIGMTDLYNIREDGVKCYGPFVIVAADPRVHRRFTFVETSLGTGIVLDVHTTDNDPELIDIATNW